jgi:hypothetical protein
MKYIFGVLASSLFFFNTALASTATDELMANYKTEGAKLPFDAERGAALWKKESKGDEDETMSCSGSCHHKDLNKPGKHHKTGKAIEPMAPSVNKERLTDVKKIEKWFKRNCNDAWSRACTPQEKGDILEFLKHQ